MHILCVSVEACVRVSVYVRACVKLVWIRGLNSNRG